jgi:hypothetical protein
VLLQWRILKDEYTVEGVGIYEQSEPSSLFCCEFTTALKMNGVLRIIKKPNSYY